MINALKQDCKRLSELPLVELHVEQNDQTVWDRLIYVEEKIATSGNKHDEQLAVVDSRTPRADFPQLIQGYLSPEDKNKDLDKLEPESKRRSIGLYLVLLMDNIPRIEMDVWVDFGFCTCKNQAMEAELGRVYRALIDQCTLYEFYKNYEGKSLEVLIRSKNIANADYLKSSGVVFGNPSKSVYYLKHLLGIGCAFIFIIILIIYRQCRTITTLLILNSIIAGFIVNVMYVYQVISQLTSDGNDKLCILRGFLLQSGCGLLYHTLCVQALYRFFATIPKRQQYLQSKYTITFIVLVQWFISITFNLPILIDGRIKFQVNYRVCQVLMQDLYGFLYLSIWIYFFPLIIIIGIYTRLLIYIKQNPYRLIIHQNIFKRQRQKYEFHIFRHIIILIIILIIMQFPNLLVFFIIQLTDIIISNYIQRICFMSISFDFCSKLITGVYLPYYEYEQTFDLQCALSIIISMNNIDIKEKIYSIEILTDIHKRQLKILEVWKDTLRDNQHYSNLLNLINNFDEKSAFEILKDQIEQGVGVG
ncbi:unnamed protein product [Rotaria sp. Silwood1]|nr:unnamed protein product [Rotaria sp. Silwood1]